MKLSFLDPLASEIARTQTHIYLRPHPLLQRYIAHYTICPAFYGPVPKTLSLVPDASGCFIFTFEHAAVTTKVFGATTQMVTVQNDSSLYPIRLFIEFRPGGLFHFTGLSQSELTDHTYQIQDFNRTLQRDMEAVFEKAESADDFIRKLDQLLLNNISSKKAPALLQSAILHLSKANGMITIRELSQLEYYSERHLNRVFQDYTGVSAKTFARLLRINDAISRMKDTKLPFVHLAQETGYYDQSHFIHDFKLVCGVTPGEYLSQLSMFYNEPLKLSVPEKTIEFS